MLYFFLNLYAQWIFKMNNILEEVLLLDDKDFIDQIISLPQQEVLHVLNQDTLLKAGYYNRVLDIYNNHVADKTYVVKGLKFAQSLALITLLPIIGRSSCFFFSLYNGNNFKAAYNCSLTGIELNSNHMLHFPRLAYEELNRLSDAESFPHLENNIDYLLFTEKAFKLFIKPKEYLFFLYYSLVQHVRNGLKFNHMPFLQKTGLIDDTQESLYKEHYLTNTYALIDQYKKVLHFSEWNSDLLNLFYTNIHSKERFDIMNQDFWKLEIKNFQPHAEFMTKLLLKESFFLKFPQKDMIHKEKRTKI